MSQQNVEIVRRHLDAYSRRDLKLLRALSDPDPEIDWSSSQGCSQAYIEGSMRPCASTQIGLRPSR